MSAVAVIDTSDLDDDVDEDGFGPSQLNRPESSGVVDQDFNSAYSFVPEHDNLFDDQLSQIQDEEEDNYLEQSNSYSWVHIPPTRGDDSHVLESDSHVLTARETERLSQLWSSRAEQSIRDLDYSLTMTYLNTPFNHPVTQSLGSWFGQMLPNVLQYHVHDTVFPLPIDTSPAMSSNKRQSSTPETVYDKSIWRNIAQRAGNSNWVEYKDASRTAALGKWRGILQIAPEHSSFGRSLLQDVLHLKSDEQLTRSIEDALSSRSVKTLHKRADYLIKYISWCTYKQTEPFPFKENVVYNFLYDCSWKSPSFASTFRESLHFSGGLLGFDQATQVADSPRIAGFCARTKATQMKKTQAKVLTVDQVTKLEKLVTCAEDPVDRILSGHMLFVLYSRSRWSDAQAVEELIIDHSDSDHGFIEAKTTYVKTANTTDKKRMFLPLTAITDGLYDSQWSVKWLHERKEYGLLEPQPGVPLLPAVATNGRFSMLPMSPATGSACLRDLLMLAGCTKDEVRGISSHSLKATCLSWAAKGGLSRETRQILGYHIAQGAKTALHYSRDEQAEPLRKLSMLLAQIRNKEFDPDSTRSGYWVNSSILLPTPKSKPVSVVLASNIAQPDDARDTISSSSSSTSTSSSSSAKWSDEERVFNLNSDITSNAKRRKGAATDSSSRFAVHKRWRTLHCVKSSTDTVSSSSVTACGRAVTTQYKVFRTIPAVECTNCLVCFGDKSTDH
jgi:hypothetical protein